MNSATMAEGKIWARGGGRGGRGGRSGRGMHGGGQGRGGRDGGRGRGRGNIAGVAHANSVRRQFASGQDRPKHTQRAAFDAFLQFQHPGIDTSASAVKFLTALQDQVSFSGVKEVVWKLVRPAVAAEQHSRCGGGASGSGVGHHGSMAGRTSPDVMDDKAPGVKRVEEFLRCAASNEAGGMVQMVLPLLEALIGSRSEGGGLIDRAMADVLVQVCFH